MKRGSPSDTVARFAGAAIASIAIIGIGLVFVAHGITEKEAIRNARNVTLATGANAITPVLSDGVLTGDPEALAAVDKVVRATVLHNDIVRVKLWAPDGRILYSDDSKNIGRQFPLDGEELEALNGVPAAGLSNLDKPENQNETQFHKLLEVYDGIRTPSGKPLLFEAYLRYDSINSEASRLLSTIFPPLIGGLFVLLLLQIPLALGLARKLDSGLAERERLLRRNIETSETERRRIASDLHDGVVQRLVGSSYSLSAVGSRVRAHGLPDEATTIDAAAAELRTSVKELRSLIVNIAPPRLQEEGLHEAVLDLTASVAATGVDVAVNIDAPDLSADDELLIYRIIQEALRNITKHAHASLAVITVDTKDDTVRCTINDNGVGFDDQAQNRRKAEGHVGLGLLSELLKASGGDLVVESEQGKGTTLTATIGKE